MSLLLDLWSALKGIRATAKAVRVLSHIYNPSKPPFDKGGLWQDLVLHCFAIVIVASKSCKKRLEMSLLLDLWSALKGIRATAKAVRGLMSSITFTFPLNPPLAKGDLWQDSVLHCFAI